MIERIINGTKVLSFEHIKENEMANEIFFGRRHNPAIVKTEQSIEDFKQSTLDEFHIVQKKTRIAFLELEIQKIKNGGSHLRVAVC